MNLARVAEAQKQFDVAVERYYEVLIRQKNNVDAHFGMGEVLAAEGNTDGALREYAKVREIDPRNALVFNNTGLIYAQMGDMDEAISAVSEIDQPRPAVTARLPQPGERQFQQRKYTDARDTLQKALQIDPTSYVAWLNAG